MSYIVKAATGGPVLGEHKTKKAATAQADEMTKAHAAVDALHEGQPWEFVVEKVEDPAPPAEPVEEAA
jgi:hypothetical protein